MTVKIYSIIISLVALCFSGAIKAQNSTCSPYSFFGIGTLANSGDAHAAGMGHTGIALAPRDWVNVSNPAGLSQLDSCTFYFNFQLKGLYYHNETDIERQSGYSGNIDGITMGFRTAKWWTMALGYMPFSNVGYKINEIKTVAGADDLDYKVTYTGSGGLQRAYWNNSFSFWKKHIVIGASVGALWGSFTKKETANFADAIYGENIYNTKKYTCNNFFFEFGAQFNFDLGQNNFRFGGVFSEKTELLSSYDHIVNNDVSSQLFFDDETPLRNEFCVPRSYGLGFAYSRKRFVFSADWRASEWSSVSNAKFSESCTFKDNWSVGGGAEYAFGNYDDPFYKRLKLRLGYSFQKDYLVLRGYRSDNKGVTAGITIPMGRYRNSIVISYQYQHRGTIDAGMIEEKVKSIKIALNIRETWFLKSKFD